MPVAEPEVGEGDSYISWCECGGAGAAADEADAAAEGGVGECATEGRIGRDWDWDCPVGGGDGIAMIAIEFRDG